MSENLTLHNPPSALRHLVHSAGAFFLRPPEGSLILSTVYQKLWRIVRQVFSLPYSGLSSCPFAFKFFNFVQEYMVNRFVRCSFQFYARMYG